MLLGIDVGGTFTDAVVLRQGEVVAQAKRATTHDDVLQCVLAALDAVLQPGMAQELERVVISSTIVTNALTEGSAWRANGVVADQVRRRAESITRGAPELGALASRLIDASVKAGYLPDPKEALKN